MHTQIQESEIYKYMEETQIALLIEVVEERITTKLSDPTSSSQHESPLHLIQSNITQQYNVFKEKPTSLPCKLPNSSLWISRMRDPYIDVCRRVSQLLGF